ncbi:Uma2 family endonuclease [Streptomyces acidiscabies]|uniref:Uma2 family endonuclease n=1 Tax=Streptomyces acidiscabies TaxID=42234 RepID=UPI000B05A597|nr:Uma2 family endonuclease [Streptomyces acidiscabies]
MTSHRYQAMRTAIESIDDSVPGTFEITREGIVHDLRDPSGRHELTHALIRRRLDAQLPEDTVAHAGKPDIESEPNGILRRPDCIVIRWTDMEGQGSFDPRTLIAAIEVVSRSNPDNDWTTKLRDYPLLGIPNYAVFDPRTGTGAVFTDIHPTPEGPRYATRKDFIYGEDITIADWTISTDGLPRYDE